MKSKSSPSDYPSLAEVRDADLEASVRPLYGDALPYHNFDHALDTIAAAGEIIEHCIDEGLRVDPQVVYLALLFHDAGFHENHLARGADSKEAYSARLAREHLAARGVLHKTVRKISDAIMSTHRFGSFVTVDQKAVRAADLSGLAAPYEVFRRNSWALKDEFELLNGKELSTATWLARISETIRFYLSQEIRLTSFFFNGRGESAFHQATRANLERFVREAADS